MKLASPAFDHGTSLPSRFAREEGGRSLPLVISQVPPQAQGLGLAMDNADAARGTFTPWIVSDLDRDDGRLDPPPGASRPEVEAAMGKPVLENATLMGLYSAEPADVT